MRSSFILLLVLLLSAAASATDRKVKVVDPQSAAVGGAQVSLYRERESTPLEVRSTSGDGEVILHLESLPDKTTNLRVQVLAPGFAEQWTNVKTSSGSPLVIALHLAPAVETVVVTATRTPAPEEETASNVSLLSGPSLALMQPVSLGRCHARVAGSRRQCGRAARRTRLSVRRGR